MMEWTDESITRLRSFWAEGLSTAEIGRRMQITKNAVVGKAHRLTLSPRPSPIRKGLDTADGATQRRPAPALDTQPRNRSDAIVPLPVVVRPVVAPPAPVSHPVDNVQPIRPAAPVAEARVLDEDDARADVQDDATVVSTLRPVTTPARRRGLTCCWPLGEPGTKQFHFCGGDPVTGKPYCSEHAALAYVKLRDRRDSVA